MALRRPLVDASLVEWQGRWYLLGSDHSRRGATPHGARRAAPWPWGLGGRVLMPLHVRKRPCNAAGLLPCTRCTRPACPGCPLLHPQASWRCGTRSRRWGPGSRTLSTRWPAAAAPRASAMAAAWWRTTAACCASVRTAARRTATRCAENGAGAGARAPSGAPVTRLRCCCSIKCVCPRLPATLPQLVAFEVTKLSPTEFEQRRVPHNISGLAGHRRPSWIRWGSWPALGVWACRAAALATQPSTIMATAAGGCAFCPALHLDSAQSCVPPTPLAARGTTTSTCSSCPAASGLRPSTATACPRVRPGSAWVGALQRPLPAHCSLCMLLPRR